MIAKMKKVWLVLLERERVQALKELRKLGLVHVETCQPQGEEHGRLSRTRDELARAVNLLAPTKDLNPADMKTDAAIALGRRLLADEERLKVLLDEGGNLSRELDRAKPWGDFEVADIAALRDKGIGVRLYDVEARNLGQAPDAAEFVVLERSKRTARVAVIARGDVAPAMPPSWIEYVPYKESPAALRAGLERGAAEMAEIRARTAASAKDAPSILLAIAAVEQELAFELVGESFQKDGPVCYVKGYVPTKQAEALDALARERSWGILSADPDIDDATPTKVENGPIVRMIDPVFAFLGTVPGYREYEISMWFLIFFSLFFAMIFGDGGYGLIMLAAGAFMAVKAKASGKRVPDANRLLLVLALSTVLWGMATATWFSIPVDSLPAWLVGMSIHLISNANPQASQNIQVFCFLVGTLHLTIARVKNIIRDFPNPKLLGQLGSLAMIYGMLFFVLNLVVSSSRFPAPPYAVWLVVGGFAATIVFGAYDGNILKSFIEGLKAIIPNFLGAVGVFADIVSYIRLWAVGLAGASLGGIINSMGGGLFKPVFMIAFGVAIILFGHTLNMVLSVLSVVVHGVRLNMLEFSNHLGMEWSGIKYDPFRVTYESEQ